MYAYETQNKQTQNAQLRQTHDYKALVKSPVVTSGQQMTQAYCYNTTALMEQSKLRSVET